MDVRAVPSWTVQPSTACETQLSGRLRSSHPQARRCSPQVGRRGLQGGKVVFSTLRFVDGQQGSCRKVLDVSKINGSINPGRHLNSGCRV
uniref:Uncharacterized protein n=1 Tax=Romanomermis culicivorax TaxID=13658 RepID=A0A915L0B6_ROMCU